jgi:hypothetical protein
VTVDGSALRLIKVIKMPSFEVQCILGYLNDTIITALQKTLARLDCS